MSKPYRVEAGPMKVVAALLGDPNPLHFDPAVAARAGLGGRLVLQGPVTAAVAFEAVRAATGRTLQTADLTFRRPAVEGDVLDCDVRLDGADTVTVVVTNALGATVAEGRITLASKTISEEDR